MSYVFILKQLLCTVIRLRDLIIIHWYFVLKCCIIIQIKTFYKITSTITFFTLQHTDLLIYHCLQR